MAGAGAAESGRTDGVAMVDESTFLWPIAGPEERGLRPQFAGMRNLDIRRPARRTYPEFPMPRSLSARAVLVTSVALLGTTSGNSRGAAGPSNEATRTLKSDPVSRATGGDRHPSTMVLSPLAYG